MISKRDQRRLYNVYKQRGKEQALGRPSLNMVHGQNLLPPSSKRSFLPESEIALENSINSDYQRRDDVRNPQNQAPPPGYGQTDPSGTQHPDSSWWLNPEGTGSGAWTLDDDFPDYDTWNQRFYGDTSGYSDLPGASGTGGSYYDNVQEYWDWLQENYPGWVDYTPVGGY